MALPGFGDKPAYGRQRSLDRLEWERKRWDEGVRWVAGVDEAGRGALAGPVVAAAVVLPPGYRCSSLVRDSKELSPRQREEALREIQAVALAMATGVVPAPLVDELGIRPATRLAMRRAIEALAIVPEHLLVDAERLDISIPCDAIVKGDQLSQSIAAASILAKVTRDRMADGWDARYPAYGFRRHKGYGTGEHWEALRHVGPCPLHRLSFLGQLRAVVQEELPGVGRM